MPAHLPPFRADHVGSLLRPAELKDARASAAVSSAAAAELATVEDVAIRRAIARCAIGAITISCRLECRVNTGRKGNVLCPCRKE
jgi:hypothetical protein